MRNECGDVTSAPHVVMIFRGHDQRAHPGYVDGLRRMVAEGALRGVEFIAIVPTAPRKLVEHAWQRVLEIVRICGSELVLLHHYHSEFLPDPSASIERLQLLPHRPTIVLTNGDAFIGALFKPAFPEMFVKAARAADVTMSTSMGRPADHLAVRSNARVALLPNSVCQIRFGVRPTPPPRRTEFVVAVIASRNKSRNPASAFYWFGRRRERLVRALADRFGHRLAVFGKGWEGLQAWQGPVRFEDQISACRRADIVVGGAPYSFARYYTSNRPFIQIASGVPFVDLAVEGIDRLLRDGEHWHLGTSINELIDVCDELLTRRRSERTEMGIAAAEYVLKNHTTEMRVRTLIATLLAFRGAQLKGAPIPPPDLRFFLPEVDRAAELPLATRRWDARRIAE